MNDSSVPILLHPFPRAILHIDADAFFTSVEQALNPAFKGRPVVTGKERGIIACASYEAKAMGIKRGVSLWDAKRMCPQLVVLPSDYETYSIYSKRMFNIIRRYTPVVEESSVDEAFADLSGMRRVFHSSYQQIAVLIQTAIEKELDITVSIGLSVTKTLAKLASKHRKPRGITVVEGTSIHLFLKEKQAGEVCGIGPNGVELLHKYGIGTAWEFVQRDRDRISELLGKPGRELWDELRGESVYAVNTEELPPQVSLSKTKTFSAPSRNPDYVYARLLRNVESAFIKLRRHKLKTLVVGVLLRHSNYEEEGLEAKLNRPTSSTQEVLPMVRALFEKTYKKGAEYRSVMVFLSRLTDDAADQLELFADNLRIEKMARASAAIDEINRKYGKHTVSLGTSLFLRTTAQNDRDDIPARKKNLLQGENKRRRLAIPMFRCEDDTLSCLNTKMEGDCRDASGDSPEESSDGR